MSDLVISLVVGITCLFIGFVIGMDYAMRRILNEMWAADEAATDRLLDKTKGKLWARPR